MADDPISALRQMMSVNVDQVQASNPEMFGKANQPPTAQFDEKFWMRKGMMQPYTLGKTFAGLHNEGDVREFLTKFCNMLQSYLKVKAEKDGRKLETELFDILRSTVFCIYKSAGGEETPSFEDNSKFLAILSGFFQTYISSTGVAERDS